MRKSFARLIELGRMAQVRAIGRAGGLAPHRYRGTDVKNDLAGFDPGPPTCPTDEWIDRWRAERVRYEAGH